MKRFCVFLAAAVLAFSAAGCGFGGTGRANVNTTAQNAPPGTKGVDITLDNWRTFLVLEQEAEPVYDGDEVVSLKISWHLKLKDQCIIDNGDGTNSNEIDLSGRCTLMTRTVQKAVWNDNSGAFEIREADPENADSSDVIEPVDFVMTDIDSGPIAEGYEEVFGEMIVEDGVYTADCETYLYAEITQIKGSVIVAAQEK